MERGEDPPHPSISLIARPEIVSRFGQPLAQGVTEAVQIRCLEPGQLLLGDVVTSILDRFLGVFHQLGPEIEVGDGTANQFIKTPRMANGNQKRNDMWR